ncbi:MAG: hypothetical protein FGM33_09725 [Candidatus Kapabacteria bacterium]|nr:hypothetical protein [Candidatus Kapabacteria bacterium]
MRRVTAAWALIIFTTCHVTAQEDVLRPNGRVNITPTAEESSSARERRSASAELVVRGGIEGGLGLNMYSKTISGIISTSPLSVFSSGTGVSPTYGVYAEIGITPTMSVGLRMMVDQKSVTGSKDGLLQDCIVNDEYGVPVRVTVASFRGEFTNVQTFFAFTPVLRFDLADNFFAQVGLPIHLPTENQQITSTQTIDPSDECFFNLGLPNQSKVNTVRTEETIYPSVRFGLDAAVGYRLPIGEGLELVPRIGYQLMFTPFDNESTGTDGTRASTDPPARDFVANAASLHSLQATIALWFRL